ncbi:hypothetical protein [Paenibacillus ottowii]|nr:hypothetical protein [Paenibacillus ottowii]
MADPRVWLVSQSEPSLPDRLLQQLGGRSSHDLGGMQHALVADGGRT